MISMTSCAVGLASLIAFRAVAARDDGITIIPGPLNVERQEGTFTLGPRTRIVVDEAGKGAGEYLADQLRNSTGFGLPVSVQARARPASGTVVLTTRDAKPDLGQEGYQLEIQSKSVLVRASTPAGLFYGVQSLLQLFPAEIFAKGAAGNFQRVAPCVRIEDRPRFVWRGLLLDVARHFFTPEELKQMFDALALHKINMCQLHLTDDQGWRLQIRKYPRLTDVGAWRKSIGFNLDPKSSRAYGPDGRYGGFYTQEEIRELVAYARSRHITLVPEIEMPGHASAALACYPEYSCTGGPYSTDMAAGVSAGVYCAGREETYTFVADVLAEVGEVFPGQYIHIGGDEVTKENWKKCQRCQALMRREGLKTENELQSYFIRRVEKTLNSQGRRLIGWSEIREGGLAANATVMDWIGGALEAASAGHEVIMTPTSHCYLDYYQSRNRTKEPPAIGAFLPLHTVYSFEPIPPGLDPAFHSHILGAQGNVWTEYIPSLEQLQYMTFPRLCALAEVSWSPKAARDWESFTQRLETHCRRLDKLGINYRRGFFEK